MSASADSSDTLRLILESLKGHLAYRRQLGERLVPRAQDDAAGASPAPAQPPAGGMKKARLQAVRNELGDCRRCKLCDGREHIVFGEGNPDALLVFVGEAPGADEDRQGLPFVGRAGQLLTKIIQAIGLQRSDVYIANIIKCRPPGNRDPEDDEIRTCRPFLEKQLEVIRPRIICTLGRIAAHSLLDTGVGITRLRGRFHQRGGTMVMPTYHPSYLLRNEAKKKETWVDMQMVRNELDRQPAQP